MAVMKQVGYRYSSNNSGGLEDCIKLFFGEEKLMENGSVPEKYEEGKIDEIVEYCEQDVEVTAKLWKRANSVVEGHGFKRKQQMEDFRDDRNGDTEQDLRKMQNEIDEQFKKLGDEIRVSQFLKLLDLRPLKVRVHQQYTSESMIGVEPMAFTKLLIYKEVRNMQEKSTLCRQVRTHLDIAEDLGFTLTKVPGQTELRRFERERVTPEI